MKEVQNACGDNYALFRLSSPNFILCHSFFFPLVTSSTGQYRHGAARIIMMLNHNICESKFNGQWKAQVQELEGDLGSSLACHDVMNGTSMRDMREKAEREDGLKISDAHFIETCKISTMTHHGISLLNERLLKVTDAWSKTSPGVLAINDCFEFTLQGGCNLTSDGRHYPLLAPVELRSFIRQIDGRFPEIRDRKV